jgi:probable F420-dependent oxidoreductase
MQIGVTVRNMGTQATAETMLGCAQAAEQAGLESVWITDHIAIPPDDAEGSGGCYTDTLTTLAWLGGATSRIKLGSGVLIIPYRPALPTAKQVATVQALCGERLLLGVGIGWMDAGFKALGVDRHQRGKLTDDTLAFLNQCFAQDEVSLNGQPFLFKPRPAKPPILVGGAAPHALQRAALFGDGWLPMAGNPGKLAAPMAQYRRLTQEMGKPAGTVTVMTGLPLQDASAARQLLEQYRALQVDRLACAMRYDDVDGYRTSLAQLLRLL